MTALTLNLPEEKLRRLEVIVRTRGASVDQLFDEMSTVMLAGADAETRFRLRAQRGVGCARCGLELLEKAAGRDATG